MQQDLREQVWMGILNTDRVVRYYVHLSDKFQTRSVRFKVAIAIATSGSAVSLLAQVPSNWVVVVLLLTTAAVIWASYADYSGKAAAASILGSQYRDLAVEWRQLWYGEITADKIMVLQSKYNKIASDYQISEDEELNEKAQSEVYSITPMEFGSSG